MFLGLDQAERLISETPPEVAARFAALIATLARLRLATVVVALRSDAYAGFQALAPLVALRDPAQASTCWRQMRASSRR